MGEERERCAGVGWEPVFFFFSLFSLDERRVEGKVCVWV